MTHQELDMIDRWREKSQIIGNGSVEHVENIISEDHLEQVDKLRRLFKEEYDANDELYNKADYHRIMDISEPWHCWRFLNHFRFQTDKALENLKNTMRWRKEYAIDHFEDKDFPKEFWLYAPWFECGQSLSGRKMVYVVGAHFRPPKEKIRQQFKTFLAYFLDRLDTRHHYKNRIGLVFENKNTSLLNVDIDLMRWLVSTRDHWPSRIDAIYVTGIPFILRPIVKMMIAWLPEEWRCKVFCGTFQDVLEPIVNQDQLPVVFGGMKDDLECRLAPDGTSWAEEMDYFQDPVARSQLDHALGSAWPKDRKEELRLRQLDHDKSKKSLPAS